VKLSRLLFQELQREEGTSLSRARARAEIKLRCTAPSGISLQY